MNKIIIDDNLILQRLEDTEDNYLLLEKWYKEKEVNKYFEQRELSLEEVRNKYRERTKENTNVPVYMIELDNKKIGIIQYTKKEDAYEVDIFIGETNLLNKGIGTKVIKFFSNYLLKLGNKVIMCPLKENKRAIKCYEKCGFIIEKEYEDIDTIGNKQIYVEMIKLY